MSEILRNLDFCFKNVSGQFHLFGVEKNEKHLKIFLCLLESPSKISVGWRLHHWMNVSFWGNGKAMKLGDFKNLKMNEIEERLLVEKKYTKRQNNDTFYYIL